MLRRVLVGASERRKEIKRRRHRKVKVGKLTKRAQKATVSEKSHIAEKIRRLTPGAEALIGQLGLEKR
jgi:hypothetical protein